MLRGRATHRAAGLLAVASVQPDPQACSLAGAAAVHPCGAAWHRAGGLLLLITLVMLDGILDDRLDDGTLDDRADDEYLDDVRLDDRARRRQA